MGLIGIVIQLIISLLWAMLVALFGMWILHATGLPVLTDISYWQTFGVALFINLAVKTFSTD